MGQQTTLKEQLGDIREFVPKAEKARDVNTDDGNASVQDGNEDVRRRERRASNECFEEKNFTPEQNKKLFEAEQERIEAETCREREAARHHKSEAFFCKSIGGAVLLMASGAFAAIAHGLFSGGGKK